jgi:hypothetical protein
MNNDVVSKMIKLNGELAKVIVNDKPSHQITILLQSSLSNSIQENQINLSFFDIDEIFEGKELKCRDYVDFLKKNFFYENYINPKTKVIEFSKMGLLHKTVEQANKDNVFLKDLNDISNPQEIDSLFK